MSLLIFKKINFIILILLCIYFILATKDILLPGLNYDEAFCATRTIALLLNKKDVGCASEIFLWGKKFPLMIGSYLPALEVYILLPFFIFLGISVFSLRIASISFGLFTLIFTYFFAKEFFNRKTALITILLLVTSPYFITSTKIGNYLHSYWIFFSVSSLFCILRWYRGGNIFYFLSGMLLLGLGSSQVGWFVIFVIGVLVSAFIFWKDIKKRIDNDRIRSFWIYFILGIVFFCLGDFLFIYANFINKPSLFITFKYIFIHLRTASGVNNLNYIENCIERFRNLFGLLRENDIYGILSDQKGNIIQPFLFFSVLLWLAFSLVFRKNTYFKKKKIIFILILICAIYMASPFTVSKFISWHLFILVPFIQLIISVGLIEFGNLFKNKVLRKVSWVVVFFSFSFLISFNLKIINNHYIDMRRTGGVGVWSDAIYDLADWFKGIKPSKVVELNPGLFRNLYFIRQGQEQIYDVYSPWPEKKLFYIDEIKRKFESFLKDKNTIYLLNAKGDEGEELIGLFMKSFKKAVEETGGKLIERKKFYQKNGQPVYIVYAVE